MHVVHLLSSGARGGGSEHLLGLLPALQAQGTRVHALVGRDGPLAAQLRQAGIDCMSQPTLTPRQAHTAAAGLLRHVRSIGPDAVHLHGTRAACLWSLATALAAGRPLPPSFYTVHGTSDAAATGPLDRLVRRQGERLACAGKAAVICVSAEDRRRLVGRRCVAPGRAFHVPNAVRAQRFALARQARARLRRQLRQQLQLPLNATVVGTVSRLVRQKDVATLSRAVARLPQTHLVVIGDGPKRAELLASTCAQQGRLHLLGGRDDVPSLMVAFDAFALSSRWEGEPIVLLEAMAAGLPWVATATPGAQEISGASACGELVRIGDDVGLAEALARALAARSRATLARGDAFVRHRQWMNVAQAHAALYGAVLRQ